MNIIVKQISRLLYHITNISYFRNIYKCAQGTNNKVIIVENGKEKVLSSFFYLKVIVITFAGSNNVVTIKKPFNFKKSRIHFHGSDNQLIFNENVSGSWDIEAYKDNNDLEVGKNTSCCDVSMVLHGDKVKIGEGCMISNRVVFWTDGHSVLDEETKEVINYTNEPLTIGNHVWIGERVTFTKRAGVPDNCIVGLCSVVTKKFQETNCVIAGSPAKIRKRGINWDVKCPVDLIKEKSLTR